MNIKHILKKAFYIQTTGSHSPICAKPGLVATGLVAKKCIFSFRGIELVAYDGNR